MAENHVHHKNDHVGNCCSFECDSFDFRSNFADGDGDMEACFDAFDQDRDQCLNGSEFGRLCRALFRNEHGKPYAIEQKKLEEMFNIFDKNKDGLIDVEEFTECWSKWVKKIVRPVSALIVVDVQNDFISGSLDISKCPAKQNGEEVLPVVNNLLETVEFEQVVYSLDWHPADHVSFIDNVHKRKMHPSSKITAERAKTYDVVVFDDPQYGLIEQKLWPRHCVQESWGSQLHSNLKIISNPLYIHKGSNPNVDSYSAFFDNNRISSTALTDELRRRNITDLYVCGVAYDYCVGATACDALDMCFRTILIDDASRGVDNCSIGDMRDKFQGKNGLIVNSSRVKAMTQGTDRRPELGYKAAMDLKNK